jgi:hypothetical protein
MTTIFDKKESTQKYTEIYGAMSEDFVSKWATVWRYGAWNTLKEFTLEGFVSYLHGNIDQEIERHIGKIESYPELTLPRTDDYKVCEDEYQDGYAIWYNVVQRATGFLIKNIEGKQRFDSIEKAEKVMMDAQRGLIPTPVFIDEDDD